MHPHFEKWAPLQIQRKITLVKSLKLTCILQSPGNSDTFKEVNFHEGPALLILSHANVCLQIGCVATFLTRLRT